LRPLGGHVGVSGWLELCARQHSRIGWQQGLERQIQDQLAAQCQRAPDGPLEMQISCRVGAGRRWSNVWKQSIDALGSILGLVRPSNPFHPLDGRIVRLGLHHTAVAHLGFDVELGIWWRAA
jgi:hypothetical protein